jgi:AcrR family transcriptional regulator
VTIGTTQAQNGTLTPRGERTRQRLLAAARDVVEGQGYEHATIDDIADRAGVAHGTFYLYFKSKEDIFIAIARDVSREMQMAAEEPVPEALSRYDRIRYATASYLRAYLRTRRMTGEFLAQSTRIPEVSQQVMTIRHAFAQVVERSLRHHGGERKDLDVEVASYALTGMVSWFAFDWLYCNALPFDESRFDEVVETLSRIWYVVEQSGELPREFDAMMPGVPVGSSPAS